jgi:hypothetical protein
MVGVAVFAGAVRWAPCAAPPSRSSPTPTTTATCLDMSGGIPTLEQIQRPPK